MSKKLLPALALALLLPAAASAELKGRNEVSVQAGFLNYEGDTNLDAGLALGARLGHFFTEELSAEALLFRSGGDVTAFYPGVAGSYHFRFGKWLPFAQAGLGVMRVNAAGAAADSAFSLHWGGGLKYFYKPDFLLRADLSHIISAEKGPGTHDLLGVVGVSWLFGSSLEEAKKVVEQVRQAVAADSDRDGVADDKDNCANTPAGSKVDAKGCPLPPPDGDTDGVADGKDQCEGTPAGTKVDQTGCPEGSGEIPADEWVLKGVNFEVGSDVLTSDSLQVLDGAAAVLLPRKNVRIEVQGHTDSTGDAQKNLELSDKRAVAVKNYLAGKGVDAGRLETKGYGSSVPVGDNATPEGRAANRRIEFKVLSR